MSKDIKLPIHYPTTPFWLRAIVRNKYIEEQGGKCHHCDQTLEIPNTDLIEKTPINKRLFPDGFFNHPVHLHHSHDTGLTIGAVHCHCNAILWQYHGE